VQAEDFCQHRDHEPPAEVEFKMDDSIYNIFREEAREHLGALEKGFLDLETADVLEARRNLIDKLFRHAHSLKGDAKVMGLATIKEAAQLLEDLLDSFRDHPADVNPAGINRGLAQLDQVRGAFEAWQQQGKDDGSVAQESVTATPTQTAATNPAPQLSPPGPASLRVTPLPAENHAAMAAATPEESFTVRVPAERLDRMLNLAGEIRISHRSTYPIQSRLAEVSEHLTASLGQLSRLSESEHRQILEFTLDQLRRVGSALHSNALREEMLMEGLENDIRQARLLPLLMLADTMRRAVRDLSQTLGKSIRYEADVGQVMLDKAVIEALKDPLLHLIRNAADHGIEPPDMRREVGKPAEGVIRIQARQRGQLVHITVSDDGRGVDFERIRSRLRRTGELNEAELNRVTEQELLVYLFKPGFTTAPVGETSGRGVGLDIVSDTIRKLQGTVEVQATSNEGTQFGITIPVTISTVRILTVSTAGQYFGIPVSAVVRTGRTRRSELRELDGGLVLSVDGAPVRWTHLTNLLGMTSSRQVEQVDTWSYLLIAQDGKQTVVAVDELEAESEVLLKPLGFPLSGTPGLFGATIRPDGSVQLVLDIACILRARADFKASVPIAPQCTMPRILLVDDSPTTRAILRNVFAAAGYAVVVATDGMDALERLGNQSVDLVVTDVEMPRLNGFDLTRQIKSKFRLPVILVTGREKEEHRREGLEAGADAYVVKSTFEGKGLLEIVEQFV